MGFQGGVAGESCAPGGTRLLGGRKSHAPIGKCGGVVNECVFDVLSSLANGASARLNTDMKESAIIAWHWS